MSDQPRLILIEGRDHTIYYGLTHTAQLPRREVEALTAQQRAYLDERLPEVTTAFESILRGLLVEARGIHPMGERCH